MKRQESINGVGIGKSSLKNDDICNELVLSNKEMRFDQIQRDKDREDEKRRLKEEEDEALMREADAVLAETNDVLKRRKEALYAKNVEGRDSLHDLDYIFSNTRKNEIPEV